MSREPTPVRVVWRRWLAGGLVLVAIGFFLSIIGVWGDTRWAITGAFFWVPGAITTITAGIQLDSAPRNPLERQRY